MSKILLAVSALLIAASAYFGFAAKNKIGELRGDYTALNSSVEAGKKATAEAGTARKAAEEQLSVANTKAETAATEASGAKAELAKVQAQITAKDAEITAKNDEITKLNLAKATPEGAPAPVAANAEELTQAQTQLKEVQVLLAKSQDDNKLLTARAGDAESRMKVLADQESKRQGKVAARGLEGSVLAVNQGWSFVVLGIGDRQGVVANAEMVIVRGGQAIGKVRVSSVEPSTAIADIIPGTLAKGVRVQPGDRVIYPGGA